jgi:tRNA (cmo5U34)-methyltransferase
MSNERDPSGFVGDGIKAGRAAWSFGGTTPQTFEQHVLRSVPQYENGHKIVLQLSDFFVTTDSVCYEIGTSTGKLIRALATRHNGKGRWIGIDIEPSMIEFAAQTPTSSNESNSGIQYELADACDYEYQPCDLVVAYYTIQFVRPRARQSLIDTLFRSLNWGGALVMFEKVRAPDARFQDICASLYQDFKLDNDFSPEEIIAKSSSLRGVLEPFSSQANVDLLRRAGFVDIMSVFKHVCFEGILAIK